MFDGEATSLKVTYDDDSFWGNWEESRRVKVDGPSLIVIDWEALKTSRGGTVVEETKPTRFTFSVEEK